MKHYLWKFYFKLNFIFIFVKKHRLLQKYSYYIILVFCLYYVIILKLEMNTDGTFKIFKTKKREENFPV